MTVDPERGRGIAPRCRHLLIFMASVISCILSSADSAHAWIYPEHRDITVLSVQGLDPERHADLDRLWTEARAGHEKRLCEHAADASQGEKPPCIDWAAWPAIAGDHSCSAEGMVASVLTSDWILPVADIAAELKKNLLRAKNRSQRANYLRDSDIRLQRADQEYATRAGSNNVHFLAARQSVEQEGIDYVTQCVVEGAEPNAIAAYVWHHLSALEKAARLADPGLAPEQRATFAQAAFADEAFALHFLEDTYASGHVAGTWGDTAQRKGTHDYYNERGIETTRWKGNPIVLLGDAWMRSEDAERASAAIRTSIEQFLDAASGRSTAVAVPAGLRAVPESLNVCTFMKVPAFPVQQPGVRTLLVDVIRDTPVPGLGPGPGDFPRFRSELGPFIGLSTGAYARQVDGGFGATQTTDGTIGGLDVALRLGFGLEGVLNEAGDGLIYLDLGVRQDAASTMKISEAPSIAQGGAITAAIPSRSAYTVRLRMPFWLIPGDLLLALPVLAFSPDTYTKMAVVASNGGLIPWQSGIATPIGRFQFVLGREVGISFYGHGQQEDHLLIPSSAPGGTTLIKLRSVSFDFPVLEYRPFRSFSLDQSSSLIAQLYFGFESSQTVSPIVPAGAPEPDMKRIWYTGIRMAFDWRNYF